MKNIIEFIEDPMKELAEIVTNEIIEKLNQK